jgi:hypothetical protein
VLISIILMAAMPVAAPASEEMICKREKQVGSMVRTKKICRTKGEWSELAKQSRDELHRIHRTKAFPAS